MRTLYRSLFVLGAALAACLQVRSAPLAAPGAGPATGGVPVEVRFTDNSNMKVQLQDSHLEVETPYGKLRIPVADVRKVEFATRLPADVAKRIETAVANLSKDDFEVRDKAMQELLALKERAYHHLVKVTKGKDVGAAKLAQEILDKIGDSLPEEMRTFREHDVVHTDQMKVTGRILTQTLQADTFQFGPQQLRVAVLHTLTLPGAEPEIDPKMVNPEPGHLGNYAQQLGKRFFFRVTGNPVGVIYGTDVYTSDSHLATAAVHAGVLKPGQNGIVKVTIVPAPQFYTPSTRNGVTSNQYNGWAWAYRIDK
jgi:hypothetical protein